VVLGFLLRGALGLLKKRPLMISLEITHSCTGNCKHCDKGGAIDGEVRAGPERFVRICRELKPVLVQVSGGEPLLREDVYEIIRGIRALGDLPYIVLVTNGSLLTFEGYSNLKAAGVDHFSISLDHPDERHDESRNIPGLYAHLSGLVPKITSLGNFDVTLESVIRKDNIRDIPDLIRTAERWGANINFSVYTPLRTGDASLLPDREGAEEFGRLLPRLSEWYRRGLTITSPKVLRRYYKFLSEGKFPGCRAGTRFVTVNPDGRFVLCAMYPDGSFDTLEELLRGFPKRISCEGCYISSRANSEKSLCELLTDTFRIYVYQRSSRRIRKRI